VGESESCNQLHTVKTNKALYPSRIIPGSLLLPALLFSAFVLLPFPGSTADSTPVRVLLLSGQNNHDWKQTTPRLKTILEESGRFKVDVTDHPERCDADSFEPYDVLVSNWNGWGESAVTNWPAVTRKAFLDFISRGKGLVTVHGGSSSFYDWPEYQQAAGGSWKLGQTGHGLVHEFEVRMVDREHPITSGLEAFRTTDELWHRTGFQSGVQVLAAAFSAEEKGGSGADEPVAVVTRFDKGRSFFLVLGHDLGAMEAEGFQALLRRGTEWAATGKVTVEGAIRGE
jgi:uncharacterized protein